MSKKFLKGFIKFIIFYIIFVFIASWVSPFVNQNPYVCPITTLFIWLCGGVYYTKKQKKEKDENNQKDIEKELDDNAEIKFEEMFVLPGSDSVFTVEDNFRLGKFKCEGVPYISYIGPNFIKHFLHRVEPARSKRTLNRYRTLHALGFSIFSSIIARGGHNTYIADIWDTLILWEKGYKVLLNNGNFNIFPVRWYDNEVWYIIVTGDSIKCSWEIEAYRQIGDVHKKENIYSQN